MEPNIYDIYNLKTKTTEKLVDRYWFPGLVCMTMLFVLFLCSCTSLVTLAGNGDLSEIQVRVSEGGDIDEVDEGWSALEAAAKEGHMSLNIFSQMVLK